MASELVARLGIDKTGYTKGLGEAEKDFQNFSRRTSEHGKKMGGELTETFHGAHKVLKAFGAVAIFKEFIEGFKAISEWAEKFGDRTDSNVRGAIRWGNAWKGAMEGVKSGGAQVLGYLTKAGEYVGGLLKGQSADQTDREQAGEDAANAAEAARDKQRKENNPEEVARLRKEIREAHDKAAEDAMTDQQKLYALEQKRVKLINDAANVEDGQIKKSLEAELATTQNEQAIAAIEKKISDHAEESAKRKKDHEQELQKLKLAHIKELENQEKSAAERVAFLKQEMANKSQDRSKMTVQELAGISRFAVGTSIATGEAGQQARDALKLQEQANKLRLSGDVEGAMGLFAQSDDIIKGLAGKGGPLRSTENPESVAQTHELELANEKLAKVVEALKGKFVAED